MWDLECCRRFACCSFLTDKYATKRSSLTLISSIVTVTWFGPLTGVPQVAETTIIAAAASDSMSLEKPNLAILSGCVGSSHCGIDSHSAGARCAAKGRSLSGGVMKSQGEWSCDAAWGAPRRYLIGVVL